MVYNMATDVEGNMFIPGMKRTWWGSKPPLWKRYAHPPYSYVRLSHTGTPECADTFECRLFMQTIQKFYMDEAKLPDIPYSFLIGGDGRVYRGRGWFNEPARPRGFDWLAYKCLEVAFIGNYETERPRDALMKLALDLVTYGVRSNRIKSDYKLIQLGESPKEIIGTHDV